MSSPSAFQKLINGVGHAAVVLYILWPKKHRGPGLVNLGKDVVERQWKLRRWYML